ncbi:ankyrin repeat domain-containing protein [Sphingomonas sp.]|uniref:ankyrin repeat domain-containing protein n=1 Tax=Sphingomonas sp. TaxID=28214 RepID=UPI0025EF6389|nr:ankyrin repeat domain-containing protein [Sphingomonas sp.]
MAFRVVGPLLAAALLLPTAAYAQFSGGFNFLKAVKDRDGAKVTELISTPGSGPIVIDTRDAATGEAALHIVTKGRDIVWLNFLLSKGANTNLRDGQGNTSLFLATQIGWAEGISLLLQRGASVDMANNGGETPLIRAVQNRDMTTVKMLLAAGASPSKHDTGAGMSARDYAVRDPRASLILKTLDEARPRAKAAIGPN